MAAAGVLGIGARAEISFSLSLCVSFHRALLLGQGVHVLESGEEHVQLMR